jgi:hypothetical protein
LIGKDLLACSAEPTTHEVKGECNEGANRGSDFTLDPCGMMEKAGEQKQKRATPFDVALEH